MLMGSIFQEVQYIIPVEQFDDPIVFLGFKGLFRDSRGYSWIQGVIPGFEGLFRDLNQ